MATVPRNLKAISRAYGGKFIIQSGKEPGETRDYWQIATSLHPLSPGHIVRSSQIHRSWCMTPQRQENPNWRRTLNIYALVYITKGRGIFRDNRTKKDHPVQAGSLLCLFPGVGHVYGPEPGTRWNEISIDFTGLVFDAWVSPGLLDPLEPVRKLLPVRYWLKRFHDVVLPLAKRRRDPSLSDTGSLLALIVEMCKAWQMRKQGANAEWADIAKRKLVELPLNQQLDLAKMALSFGLGEQAYRKKFARICGTTPSLYRSRHLIEHACNLLGTSDLSIKEIAFSLGFSTTPYFSRRFRQITGFTPGQYRDQSRH